MRFYTRKAPRKKADILIDKLASGKCDDLVVSELKVAVDEESDPEELQRITGAVLDIVMNSSNNNAVAYALKSLMMFLPMGEDIESALDNRALMLVEDKSMASNKQLIEAISLYVYQRTSDNTDTSRPFIPALLPFLEECSGAAAAISYEVLIYVAAERPEFFEQHTALLTKELGSINNATRVYSARIITQLAKTHPEYMAEAEKTLLHLSTFYPDAEVKSAAAEAYQTIRKNQTQHQQEPDVTPQFRSDSTGGFADIMRRKASDTDKKQGTESRIDNRLLSLAANFARKSDMRNGQTRVKAESRVDNTDSEAMDKIMDDFSEIAGVITGNQDDEPGSGEVRPAEEKISREEAELRDMVAQVKIDFSESAESLLDSLGMKHLHRDQLYKVQEAYAGKDSKTAVPVHQDTAEKGAGIESRVTQGQVGEPQVIRETNGQTMPAEMADSRPKFEEVGPRRAEKSNLDHHKFIDSIEKMISETDINAYVEDPITIEPQMSTPVEPLESAVVLTTDTIEENFTENIDNKLMEPVQNDTDGKPDQPEKVIPSMMPKAIKAPVIPEGVRISAVKFKTLDMSKKQPPAKISIKPHIKPLNRTPRDINKIAQQRSQTSATVQPDEGNTLNDSKADIELQNAAATQPKTENSTADTPVCPSCNEKIVGDSQFCLKCGADLKSQKIRCTRCSQINTRETSSCVRCGARMMKSQVKQPDML